MFALSLKEIEYNLNYMSIIMIDGPGIVLYPTITENIRGCLAEGPKYLTLGNETNLLPMKKAYVNWVLLEGRTSSMSC